MRATRARQQAQAARDGGGAIYTPQVVIDGRSWPAWYRGNAGPQPIAATATTRVSVARVGGDRLHVRVQTQAAPSDAFRNYLALTQDGLSSAVRAGENRGATLRHDDVVRAFAGPLALAAADADLPLPRDADPARLRVVAFVQRRSDGAVAQALTCPVDASGR